MVKVKTITITLIVGLIFLRNDTVFSVLSVPSIDNNDLHKSCFDYHKWFDYRIKNTCKGSNYCQSLTWLLFLLSCKTWNIEFIILSQKYRACNDPIIIITLSVLGGVGLIQPLPHTFSLITQKVIKINFSFFLTFNIELDNFCQKSKVIGLI